MALHRGALAWSVPERQWKHHGRNWKARAQRHAEDGGSADDSGRAKVPEEAVSCSSPSCKVLRSVLLGMLRSLSGRVARHTGRGTRQKQGNEVFRSWVLLQVAEELHVRRVRRA